MPTINKSRKNLSNFIPKNNLVGAISFSSKLINYFFKFKAEYFLLLFIIGIGFWLRIHGILNNSFAFTYDVGRDMIALQSIVYDHKIPLIGPTAGIEGIFYGPWWYYILTIPFLISSGNPQFIAFFIVLSGLLTILIGYILGKKIGGIFLGLLLSSLISFSPVLIGISNQIWNPNLAPFFLLIAFYIIHKIFKNFDLRLNLCKYFLILGFVLGLIIDTELVFGVLLLLSVSIFLLIQINKRLRIQEIIFYLIGIIFAFSPRILFEVRHNFLMTKTIISSFRNTSSSNFDLIHNLLNRLNVFNNMWKATLAGQNELIGVAFILFIIFVLVKSYRKIKNEEKIFIKMILITLLVFVLTLTFISRDIWDYYLIGIPVFYVFLLGISINFFKRQALGFRLAFIIALFVIFINLKPLQIIDEYNKPLWEGDASVYRNQLFVIDYIYKEAKGQTFNEIVYTPPVHDYTYQYLFSWYGENKYGYTPSKDKAKLFFLIMEPDLEYPFRLENWLKIREKDGKIIKEEKLKGGIVVQTRIH